MEKHLKFNPGIVIQGPLISKGRTGKTAEATLESAKLSDIVCFDCSEVVGGYLELNNKFEVIFSTWEGESEELQKKIVDKYGKKSILLNRDDTKSIQSLSVILPANNKYRQFKSTLAGVEFLHKQGCTHIIKVRSDMKIPVLKLWNNFLFASKRREINIMVPWMYQNRPDFFHDIYFVSEIENMLEFLKLYMNEEEIYESVHLDLFYRFASFLGMWTYSKSIHGTKIINYIYTRMWNKYLCPASREIFIEAEWRGSKFKSPYIYGGDIKYLEDLSENYKVDRSYFNTKTIANKINQVIKNRKILNKKK